MSQVASPQAAPDVAPETLLRASGIKRSFAVGDRRLEVLHGVDLELNRGTTTALVGSSGAGKSTLLHILGLLDRPSEGSLEVVGRDPWRLNPRQRSGLRNAQIGFVFQFYHLLPELTAVENVLLPAMVERSWTGFRRDRRELRERAVGMLTDFGLADRLKHRPSQLSGGERQRVAIARALFNAPSLLIADEPTGNLDSHTGAEVLEVLFAEQQRRQFALLLVTHDSRVASACQRTLSMTDGVIR
ncbi:MAG: ABC transporter ATP-binding protein [Planctomycetota bacterium]